MHKKSQLLSTLLPSLRLALLILYLLAILTGCKNTSQPAQDPDILSFSGTSWDINRYEIALAGIDRTYSFVILNDLHIITDSEDVLPEKEADISPRHDDLFVDGAGNKMEDLWLPLCESLNTLEADGIIIAGDLVDFYSRGNLELIGKGLSILQAPYLYLRADHDYGAWNVALEKEDITKEEDALCENGPILSMEFPGFTIAGINNSTSQIKKAGWSVLKPILTADKPVILFTHVPLRSLVDDSLSDASKEAWGGRVLLWGEDCYYQPKKRTRNFLDLLYSSESQVKAVFAGHLHFPFEDMLTETIPQYVLDANYKGNISLLQIVPG